MSLLLLAGCNLTPRCRHHKSAPRHSVPPDSVNCQITRVATKPVILKHHVRRRARQLSLMRFGSSRGRGVLITVLCDLNMQILCHRWSGVLWRGVLWKETGQSPQAEDSSGEAFCVISSKGGKRR